MAERDLVCKVCGKEFTPRSYNKKVVKTMSGKHYDTFDCPKCGCQVIANERIVDGQDDRKTVNNGKVSFRDYHKHLDCAMNDIVSRIDDIVYSDYADIVLVSNQLKKLLEQYSSVTVADYLELTGNNNSIPFMACKYGWVNLDNMKIKVRTSGGYELEMPRVLPLG